MWSAGPCTHDPKFRTQANNGGCIIQLPSLIDEAGVGNTADCALALKSSTQSYGSHLYSHFVGQS